MQYSREVAIKFWYEFDRPFNPLLNGELVSAVNKVGVLIGDYNACMDPMNGTLDIEKFTKSVASHNIDQELSILASKQLEIMTRNFLLDEKFSNIDPLQFAFEDFGRVLYDRDHDDERTWKLPSGKPHIDPHTGNPMIFRIHMMDSYGSYIWWHSFIRAYA